MANFGRERRPFERGIGCASIFPAAIIGLAGLTDEVGPRGLAMLEILGWTMACVAVGLGVGGLLAQWRSTGWRRYLLVPLSVAAVAAFTYAINWLGLDAPMSAKVIFTTTLRIIGSLGSAALVLWFGYMFWTQRRA